VCGKGETTVTYGEQGALGTPIVIDNVLV